MNYNYTRVFSHINHGYTPGLKANMCPSNRASFWGIGIPLLAGEFTNFAGFQARYARALAP
ncbi:hypothetical protein N9383_02110 [Granulosicoccus sp.]|nr:hypothetical protein [Granulosicoccus sp.]